MFIFPSFKVQSRLKKSAHKMKILIILTTYTKDSCEIKGKKEKGN